MLKVNEPKFADNYLEIELFINDYSQSNLENNIIVLKEVLDFLKKDLEFAKLDKRTITLVKNELAAHIELLEWDIKAFKTLNKGGEKELIDQHKITHLNLNVKVFREYKAILRLFNAKLNLNNTRMNLGYVIQY